MFMRKTFFLFFLIFINVNLYSIQNLPGLENLQKAKIKQLYKNLDQKSVVQHFAFYRIYPETEEGKLALKKA